MVQGKLALIIIGQRLTELTVGAGMGYLGIFTRLSSLFYLLFSLGDGPIYTEILSQRGVKPKTSNQQTHSNSSAVW